MMEENHRNEADKMKAKENEKRDDRKQQQLTM